MTRPIETHVRVTDCTAVGVQNNTVRVRSGSGPSESFPAAAVHAPECTNGGLYEQSVKRMVNGAVAGQNCMILVTGTEESRSKNTLLGEQADPGILPRAIDELCAQSDVCVMAAAVAVSDGKVVDLSDGANVKFEKEPCFGHIPQAHVWAVSSANDLSRGLKVGRTPDTTYIFYLFVVRVWDAAPQRKESFSVMTFVELADFKTPMTDELTKFLLAVDSHHCASNNPYASATLWKLLESGISGSSSTLSLSTVGGGDADSIKRQLHFMAQLQKIPQLPLFQTNTPPKWFLELPHVMMQLYEECKAQYEEGRSMGILDALNGRRAVYQKIHSGAPAKVYQATHTVDDEHFAAIESAKAAALAENAANVAAMEEVCAKAEAEHDRIIQMEGTFKADMKERKDKVTKCSQKLASLRARKSEPSSVQQSIQRFKGRMRRAKKETAGVLETMSVNGDDAFEKELSARSEKMKLHVCAYQQHQSIHVLEAEKAAVETEMNDVMLKVKDVNQYNHEDRVRKSRISQKVRLESTVCVLKASTAPTPPPTPAVSKLMKSSQKRPRSKSPKPVA